MASVKKVKRSRSPNWSNEETKVLAELKRAAVFSNQKNGNVWYQISVSLFDIFKGQNCPVRSEYQCRRRWDTLVKAYNHIERYCIQTGQDHWELDEDELESMRLNTAYNKDWYTIVKEVSSQCKRKSRTSVNASHESQSTSSIDPDMEDQELQNCHKPATSQNQEESAERESGQTMPNSSSTQDSNSVKPQSKELLAPANPPASTCEMGQEDWLDMLLNSPFILDSNFQVMGQWDCLHIFSNNSSTLHSNVQVLGPASPDRDQTLESWPSSPVSEPLPEHEEAAIFEHNDIPEGAKAHNDSETVDMNLNSECSRDDENPPEKEAEKMLGVPDYGDPIDVASYFDPFYSPYKPLEDYRPGQSYFTDCPQGNGYDKKQQGSMGKGKGDEKGQAKKADGDKNGGSPGKGKGASNRATTSKQNEQERELEHKTPQAKPKERDIVYPKSGCMQEIESADKTKSDDEGDGQKNAKKPILGEKKASKGTSPTIVCAGPRDVDNKKKASGAAPEDEEDKKPKHTKDEHKWWSKQKRRLQFFLVCYFDCEKPLR